MRRCRSRRVKPIEPAVEVEQAIAGVIILKAMVFGQIPDTAAGVVLLSGLAEQLRLRRAQSRMIPSKILISVVLPAPFWPSKP